MSINFTFLTSVNILRTEITFNKKFETLYYFGKSEKKRKISTHCTMQKTHKIRKTKVNKRETLYNIEIPREAYTHETKSTKGKWHWPKKAGGKKNLA